MTLKVRLLGGLSLDSTEGPLPAAASQRRRLMLLALLAAAGARGVARIRVAACLWPESPEERSRHALDQLLYAVRRDLQCDVVISAGGTLRLNEALLTSDLAEFNRAVTRGADADAAASYGGAFLEDAVPSGTDEFDRWAERERDAIQRRYCAVLERLAMTAERARDHAAALHWRQQRLAVDPCDGGATVALMKTMALAGDAAAVRQQAAIHARTRRAELDLDADPVVQRAATDLIAGIPAVAVRPEPIASGTESPVGGAAPVPVYGTPVRTSRGMPVRPPRRRWAAAATGLAAVVLLLAGSSHRQDHASPPTRAAASVGTPRAVAVLPIRNMTGDPAAEYLGDGMTEEIIHVLSQVPEVRVVARTSAFAFKGRDADVRRIGRQLGAEAVIDGSIRRRGGRLVVTVQLVDVVSGYQRWSHRFEASDGDLRHLDRQIAWQVATHMTPVPTSISRHVQHEPSLPAYDQYLRARFSLRTGGAEAVASAVADFTRATRTDPRYGRAWAGLAEAYNRLAQLRTGTPEQVPLLTRAELTARHAILIDSSLSDAHEALGEVLMSRWDWEGAENALTRAMRINPSSATAHARFATLLTLRGRFEEALPALRRAQELDPLSLDVHTTAGYLLVLAQRYGEAERLLRIIIAAEPRRARAHFLLGTALVHMQRHEEAVREFETTARLTPAANGALPMLGYAYARSGRFPDALRLRPAVEEGMRNGQVSPYFTAAYLNEVGARKDALTLLSRLGADRESCLQDLAVDPTMASLRGDPVFKAVLQTVGLDQVDHDGER